MIFTFFDNSRMQRKKTALFINHKNNLFVYFSYHIFQSNYHTRCIMLKRVTSLHSHLCSIAHEGKTALLEEMPQQWRATGNIVSDLTDPRFEPQTYCSRGKCSIARQTGTVVNSFLLTTIFISLQF